MAEQNLSEGVLNIVRRAKQMTQIQWTPQKNIKGWGGGVTYTAGKTYTGLPYGQPVYASYVPWSTGLDGFLEAVNDPASKMYTMTSTYNKEAPYYSVDCSAFVSWAWGLSSRQTTSTLSSFATKISASSYESAQVGDCLCLAGTHAVLITDITYDSSGKINSIEISEATTNAATYYCCQVTRYGVGGAYSLSDLTSKYFGNGYILYRSKTRDSVTYTHSCAVPLEGDVCTSCYPFDGEEKKTGATVTAREAVTKYSLPDKTSQQIGSVASGTTVEIVSFVEDDSGITWYKLTDGSWIDSSETEFTSYLKTTTVSGRVFPQSTLHAGEEFLLKGLLEARNPIVSVTASISIEGQVDQQISIGFDGIGNYTINGSELDNEIDFATLAEGSYIFSLIVLEEGCCPAGGKQKIRTSWATNFVVGPGECAHIYVGEVLAEASCEAPGVARYTCSECGAYYDELDDATGHKYATQILPASCIDYERVWLLCSRCGDSYVEYTDSVYTEWVETKPSGVDEALIETKPQYRYSEYETTVIDSEAGAGWEYLGTQWNQVDTDTVQYVPNWPAGFSTEHGLYAAYHNTPAAATETDTTKIVINSNEVTGYLYYHWCRGTYTEGPDNRKAENSMQDDCTAFHAFFSTVAPDTLETAADGSVSYANADCCKDSYWFYCTSVNTQKYATFEKVSTYGRWPAWSEWTDEEYVEDEACKVETRTLYRVLTGKLEEHTWSNDVCTYCGATNAAAVVPTLKGSSFTLSFEDEVLVNFYYTISDMTSVAEKGMLVFLEEPDTVSITEADFKYESEYDESSGRYFSATDGVAAKEMGDTRFYCVYAKLTDGTYAYSEVYQYSPKKYAMSRLEKSTDNSMKALCVAMLNYGTAAQHYFGYKTDDLMNAALTQAQKELVASYSAGLFTGPVAAEAGKTTRFSKTDPGFSKRTATVSFDGALAINYYLVPDAQVDGDIIFYCWSAEDYAAAQTLTASNATNIITMVKSGDGSYWAQVNGIAAKMIDETYYVAAVYDSTDQTLCSGVIAYSLSKYCMNHAKDGDSMQELASATAMYGYYAKAYFAN